MSFWRNRPLIITIVICILLTVLLFATSGYNKGERQDGVIGGVIARMQEGLYSVTESIGGFFSRLFGTTDLDKENLELQERVSELESQVRDYNTVIKENERLKKLLNIKDTIGDYDILTARVIAKNSGDWFTEFTVNAGSDDGIEEDMIVMTDEGLMGRVTFTAESYCKIISLMETTSGVPAMVERSRDYGVAKAAGSSEAKAAGMLKLNYLSANADVIPGDTIITSGMGGVFPKGIYIGQVTEVKADGDTSDVTIQSFVDFEHVEEVIIILEQFEKVGDGS